MHTFGCSVDTFSCLSSKYSSWEDLRNYLTSKEGGSLRAIEPPNTTLAILRYTKGVSDFTKPHVGDFRSVVWNKTTNRPVSVAPVQAEGSVPPTDADGLLRVSDFVEGTMIQAWKDASGNVGIASRTSLGAKGTFYSTRSFAELLDEALQGSDKFLDSALQPNQFISMVLQHKEHKIVGPVAHNRVFVTHFGTVEEDGKTTFNFKSTEWPEALSSREPQVYEQQVVPAEAKEIFAKYQQNTHTWQGLVFQATDSAKRWRMRNSAYMTARNLRGSEATPAERFLRLRATGDTKKYLSYFREESSTMWDLEQKLRERTVALYEAYGDMNKTKTKGMRQLPYCFRPHVYALHGKYLATLPNPISVIKETVVNYVNKLPQQEQLKILQGSLDVPVAAAPPSEEVPV